MEFLESAQNDIQKCNHCGSVFITNKACESCGIQLHLDRLGGPSSEKSFWSLKDDYILGLNPITQCCTIFYLKNSFVWRKYNRALENRYKVLLDFFFIKNSPMKQAEKFVYLLELKELISEMLYQGQDMEKLLELLEANIAKSNKVDVLGPLYHKILFWISQKSPPSTKSRREAISKILFYKILDALHVWKLGLTLVGCWALIKLTLYLMTTGR